MLLQRPLARFLRACMVLPIFVGCFIGRAHDGRGVHNAYMVVVRLLGCAVLFCFANVLSALLAKIMATHFHKDAHFSKMNDALQKVGLTGLQNFHPHAGEMTIASPIIAWPISSGS